jgi:CubicO group peptidase (beta-lactamase class C family)
MAKKQMKIIVQILVTSAILISPVWTFSQNSIELPIRDSLEKWMNAYHVPALGIGVIRQGRSMESFIYGSRQKNITADEHTLFNVASINKNVTTYLVMKLVTNKDWQLDEPLYHYWVDPDVEDELYHKKLTTRHILTHRSGFINWRWQHPTKELTFDYEPGSGLSYSGEAFEYLKEALEQKYNLTYEELVDSLVFRPLKMRQSYLVRHPGFNDNLIAIGHNETGKPYPLPEMKQAKASDDLLITIADLSTFGAAILKKTELSDTLHNQMITPQSEVKAGVAFGFGWIVMNGLTTNKLVLIGAGSDKGENSMILLFPTTNEGIIICTNSDSGRQLLMKIVMEYVPDGQEIISRF